MGKMDRMGRKLGFKKSHKRKVQNKKLKGSKTKSKGSKKKAKAPKKNKKKGKERKKPGRESAEKQSKKKRAREKKREKLKRERDRKKLQRLREKKKRQKKRLQKEEERKRKKVHKEALKKKKISKKKRLDQISRENSESSIEVKIRNPKKTTRREEKQDARDSVKKEKKLTKIWKDWLPLPSLEMQSLLRHRMADCNWEDFSDSGHSNTTHLIPRSDLLRGNIVEILSPMLLNPFDISAEDEASEFERTTSEKSAWRRELRGSLTLWTSPCMTSRQILKNEPTFETSCPLCLPICEIERYVTWPMWSRQTSLPQTSRAIRGTLGEISVQAGADPSTCKSLVVPVP